MPSKYVCKRTRPPKWRTQAEGKVQKPYVLPVALVHEIDRVARESGRKACEVAERALRAGLSRIDATEQ